MKQIAFLITALAMSLFLNPTIGQAQTKDQIVTAQLSFVGGSITYANHYFTNHEYQGTLMGADLELGAFYKKSENLSWDLGVTYLRSSYDEDYPELALANPAKTTFIDFTNLMLDYGTHYNWQLTDRLSVRAGARFDLMGAMSFGEPNSINNAGSVDAQAQFEAAGGIKYDWNFRKFGISLYGDFSVPFMGLMLVDSRYQSAIKEPNILPGNINHFLFTSFHNLQGYDLEAGVDFNFKNLTLSLSYDTFNRWWNAYELQNYRMYSLFKVGLSLDLMSVSRKESGNRYF